MKAVPPSIVYVGFWARVAATLIDTAWLLALTLPLRIALFGWSTVRPGAMPSDLSHLLVAYGVPAVLVLAFWHIKHATPGKMLFDAVIVDAQTLGPPTSRQLIVRYLGYLACALLLGVGLVMVAFDPRKRGWHDRWAGTVVVERRGLLAYRNGHAVSEEAP